MDCANGATYQLGPLVLRELGARVDAIGIDPNGLNINDGVGSTHPETLAARVQATGADLGIAFDGDGDRVLFVDGDGMVRDGDDLLYVLASDWQQSGRLQGPVVGTLMTNYALERALAERGIGFIRAKVGDRYVHQAAASTNDGVLGGEASGHLLCLDRASTGDGIVSALQVLEVLQAPRHVACGQALRRLQQAAAEDGQRALPGRRQAGRSAARAGRAGTRRRRRWPVAAARSCVRPAPSRWCA